MKKLPTKTIMWTMFIGSCFLVTLAELFFLLGCAPEQQDKLKILEEDLPQADSLISVLGDYVHIEVEPTYLSPQIFYHVELKNINHKPIIMAPEISVSGLASDAEVYIKKDQDDSKHDTVGSYSDIIALPLANKLSYLSPRIPDLKTKLNNNLIYNLNLLTNIDYSIILNPNGLYDRAPRIVFSKDINQNNQLDFNPILRGPILNGRISSQDVKLFFSLNEPHLRVGVYQGTRLVSSIALVPKSGEFNLELASPLLLDVKKIPLNLIAEPINIEAALPRITKIISLDKLSLAPMPIIDIGELDLGQLKEPFELTVNITGEDNLPITNAYIYLNGQVGNGEAMVKKEADISGRTIFQQIYEGTYDLAIIPRSSSKYAMQVVKNLSLAVGENNNLSVKLNLRQSLQASLFDHENLPVNGALIELARIGKPGSMATEDIFDDMLFKLTASTNNLGAICHRDFGIVTSDNNQCDMLALDEGRFLAHVIPPAGSKLAHKWLTFDFPAENNLKINLSKPQILSGKIISSDKQTPLKQAFVTIYLAETNTHNQPKIIGNAITDNDGNFAAFVPTE